MLRRPLESTLRPRVGVAGQMVKRAVSSRPGRHVERCNDEVSGHGPTRLPPHDPAGVDVNDEGDVDDTTPGGAVGEVGDPQLVGTRRSEVALHEVRRAPVRGVGVGGEALLGPAGTTNAQLAHNASDLFAAHGLAGALRGRPELALAVHGVVRHPDRQQHNAQLHVAQGALRGWTGLGVVVGGGGDLQLRTDRLDPPSTPTGQVIPVGVDESDYFLC